MKPGKKADPALDKRNKAMGERYAAGECVDIIAADFGLKRSTVLNIMSKIRVKRSEILIKKRNDEIIAQTLSGKTQSEIARCHSMSACHVREILRNANVRYDREARNAEIIAQYSRGVKVREIAKWCHLCAGQINEIIRKSRGFFDREARNKEIETQRLAGRKTYYIAKQFGLTQQGVRRICKERNVW